MFTGIFMIPVSVFGRVKVGAAHNALGYSTYFFAVASVLALKHKIDCSNGAVGKKLVLSTVILLTLVKSLSLFNFKDKITGFVHNPTTASYRYILAHPGDAYFPWSPLSHLMAEGRLYHFEYTITERFLTGYSMKDSEFRNYVPLKTKLVAFPPDVPTPSEDLNEDPFMKYLPEFHKKTRVPELPGWVVYERK